MGYKLTKQELLESLREQFQLLDDHISSYDQGNELMSKEIAVKIRVFVYDTNTSHSLLNHLGLKNKTKFYATAGKLSPVLKKSNPENLGNGKFSVFIGVGPGSNLIAPGQRRRSEKWKFLPNLDRMGFTQMDFQDWWEGQAYQTANKTYSRKDIVCGVANTDGGAHIDAELEADYADLAKKGHPHFTNVDDKGNETSLGSRVNPLVRQIAHELRKTINDILPVTSM